MLAMMACNDRSHAVGKGFNLDVECARNDEVPYLVEENHQPDPDKSDNEGKCKMEEARYHGQ